MSANAGGHCGIADYILPSKSKSLEPDRDLLRQLQQPPVCRRNGQASRGSFLSTPIARFSWTNDPAKLQVPRRGSSSRSRENLLKCLPSHRTRQRYYSKVFRRRGTAAFLRITAACRRSEVTLQCLGQVRGECGMYYPAPSPEMSPTTDQEIPQTIILPTIIEHFPPDGGGSTLAILVEFSNVTAEKSRIASPGCSGFSSCYVERSSVNWGSSPSRNQRFTFRRPHFQRPAAPRKS